MQPISLLFALLIMTFTLPLNLMAQKTAEPKTIQQVTENAQKLEGYFDFYWDEQTGKIWLEINQFDNEFLYVNSLSAGIGSNDIGLDRNQLGSTRIVKFLRSGPKVLIAEVNYDYRAISENAEEIKAVEDAFARSVLWGFEVAAEEDGKVLIDITSFLLRDAHGVASRLRSRKQGNYKLDQKRSAIYLEKTKNFPKNSEFEAIISFNGESGDRKGEWVRSVTPTPEALSVRMHHSFIELPDANFEPRVFDPRSGYSALRYYDYATPIDQPIVKRLIRRHRLQKKNPGATVSEAVEPIIYYLDRGAPEPIKSALIEGASWWNQAFEAAGYKNAFQVKELPEGADLMDVRYNVINWVHRSTRGWSYGSSVTDPRTGEIIKGHVMLGSLRVRQDFMIAQGLVPAYENGDQADPRLLELALARLRQLSAHEVGHTLGLAHNFASSYNDRASVMDYPHPYIELNASGKIDFSSAYDVGIGAWDNRTILYGYQDFPSGTDEEKALKDILAENSKLGFHYISDQDARPIYGAHPVAHLWDNGASAMNELRRLTKVRQHALNNFGTDNIPMGTPLATLENVLVPLFLAHRYQVEAVAKVIGGVNYTYAMRGDNQMANEMVEPAAQEEALKALLETLDPTFLTLPESIIKLIPPQPIGYNRGRELFKLHTGLTFDPIGVAESSANHTVRFLLNPQRLARIVEQSARSDQQMSPYQLMEEAHKVTRRDENRPKLEQEIARMTEKLIVYHLLQLAADKSVMPQVAATAHLVIDEVVSTYLETQSAHPDEAHRAHIRYLQDLIAQFKVNRQEFKVPAIPNMPDGSPIGCGHVGH